MFSTVLNSTAKDAGIFGYVFGLGMFGVGVNWLHISINLFGGVNLAGAFIITFVLVAYLSLYPALVAFAYQRLFANKGILAFVTVMPTLWVLAEWFRSSIFTGFPWLNIGYSQIDTPVSSLAPVVGQYGVSWFTAFISTLLVALYLTPRLVKAILVGVLIISWLGLNALADILDK